MMRHGRARQLKVGILIAALMVVLFAGTPVPAAEKILAVDSTCSCCSQAGGCSIPATHAGSAHRDINRPAGDKCGCSISAATDTEPIPALISHGARQHHIMQSINIGDGGTAPTTGHGFLQGRIAPERTTYQFLYYSSPDGRAPPV